MLCSLTYITLASSLNPLIPTVVGWSVAYVIVSCWLFYVSCAMRRFYCVVINRVVIILSYRCLLGLLCCSRVNGVMCTCLLVLFIFFLAYFKLLCVVCPTPCNTKSNALNLYATIKRGYRVEVCLAIFCHTTTRCPTEVAQRISMAPKVWGESCIMCFLINIIYFSLDKIKINLGNNLNQLPPAITR